MQLSTTVRLYVDLRQQNTHNVDIQADIVASVSLPDSRAK